VRFSHRVRLAVVAATVTGLVLLVLFVSLVAVAKDNLYAQKRIALASAMQSFTPDEDPQFDLGEFHEAYPEFSASVYDENGKLLTSVGHLHPTPSVGWASFGKSLQMGTVFKGQLISVALDLSDTDRGIDQLRTILFAIWFPIVLLVGGATWAVAVLVFRPLERLSAQALAMSGSNLSERLVTNDHAEFGAFAKDLNLLLDRVEETVRRGEQFSADAAHELRTPLAILRTRLETALLQARTQEQYETTLRRSVEEIGRLTALTEALLRSARGELLPADVCDLEPLVREAEDHWVERFAALDIRLNADVAPASVVILAEEVRVLLDNLLDNALRYAPSGSGVCILLETVDREVRLMVQDAGPGVPVELGERIFDRFVRADDSRNRGSGGSGVGLAVCRQIVMARGGRMILAESSQGGAAVGFCLPKAG